jgi:S-adenosylmethionine-diacylgycerolhomoserine-N-methlytransferase
MQPPEAASGHSLAVLERFYRFHAPIYNWSRPFILFGRERLVRLLAPANGQLVVDVGCGTGFHFELLASLGARVLGIESSPHMRERAKQRAAHLEGIRVEGRPYGANFGEPLQADRILFSYSLSMMDSYREVLVRAQADLRPGGRIGVVDFLDGNNTPVRTWLQRSHVHLGPDRLNLLKELFPTHEVRVFPRGLWQYFLFVGSGDSGSAG